VKEGSSDDGNDDEVDHDLVLVERRGKRRLERLGEGSRGFGTSIGGGRG